MTDYHRFAVTLGNDAKPLDAATCIDVVNGNLAHLESEPPDCIAYPILYGGRTTQSTAYDDASVLVRPQRVIIHGLTTLALCRVTFRLWAVTSGNTGTLRVTCSPRFRIVAATPENPDSELEGATATNAVTTTAAMHTITLAPTQRHTVMSHLGSPLPGEGPQVSYRAAYLTIQGIVANGADTLTLSRVTRVHHP